MTTEDDNKRFFYMKWKEHFFDNYKLQQLSALTDPITITVGEYATLLYVRLMNESISHHGRLRYSERQPYDAKKIAGRFHLKAEEVQVAIDAMKELELIDIEEDETIVVKLIADKIKSESGSCERMRRKRERDRICGKEAKCDTQAVTSPSQSDADVTHSYSIQLNSEQVNSKERTTPYNPPKGDEIDSRGCDKTADAEEGGRTNGAAGFAVQQSQAEGQTAYPLGKIQKAYDEAGITYGGKMPAEHRDAFCGYVFGKGMLENAQRIRNLPAYLKRLYDGWIAEGGIHRDAPQITREELAEWVRDNNPKTEAKITPEMESGFWDWLVRVGFKNGKGVRLTKWNVGGTFQAWIENRRDGNGRGKSRDDVAYDMTHMTGIGWKPRGVDFKRGEG